MRARAKGGARRKVFKPRKSFAVGAFFHSITSVRTPLKRKMRRNSETRGFRAGSSPQRGNDAQAVRRALTGARRGARSGSSSDSRAARPRGRGSSSHSEETTNSFGTRQLPSPPLRREGGFVPQLVFSIVHADRLADGTEEAFFSLPIPPSISFSEYNSAFSYDDFPRLGFRLPRPNLDSV